jgi:hypothetical protein
MNSPHKPAHKKVSDPYTERLDERKSLNGLKNIPGCRFRAQTRLAGLFDFIKEIPFFHGIVFAVH